MNILVIGTGYVGLPTSIVFVENGHNVICYDTNKIKIKKLQKGKSPIFENNLEYYIQKHLNQKLYFTDVLIKTLAAIEIIVICLPTDFNYKTKTTNLDSIYLVIKNIAIMLDQQYRIFIIKSTVPVGTCRKIYDFIKQINPSANFDIIFLPEFLREGFSLEDSFNPDRIIIGYASVKAKLIMDNIFNKLKDNNKPILYTSLESAETIKYASNAFLAVKLQYINEISNFCNKFNANIKDVAKGIGLDSRIGNKYLNPGPGYGGYCLPKDTNAIYELAKSNKVNLTLIKSAIKCNANLINNIFKKILKLTTINSGITILGLSFKANTDDCRESVAIQIIKKLLANQRNNITVYDPKAINNAKLILKNKVTYQNNVYDACKNSSLCVVLTEWDEFQYIDLNKIKIQSPNLKFFDCRYILNKNDIIKNSFKYYSI